MDPSSSNILVLQSELEEERKENKQRLSNLCKKYNNVVTLLEKSNEDAKYYKDLSVSLQDENNKIKIKMKDKFMDIKQERDHYKESWHDLVRIEQEQNEEIERLKELITTNVNRYRNQLKGIVKQQRQYVQDGTEKLEKFNEMNDSLRTKLFESKNEIERLKGIIARAGLTEGDVQDSDL